MIVLALKVTPAENELSALLSVKKKIYLQNTKVKQFKSIQTLGHDTLLSQTRKDISYIITCCLKRDLFESNAIMAII